MSWTMQRDRTLFRRALELSVLLHLLLVAVVAPRARELWPDADSVTPMFLAQDQLQEETEPPLEFEFVDLAEDREERPTSERVPMSDLDRRAHGGQGDEPSDTPGSVGNTYQLVQAEGGDVLASGSPPTEAGPPTQQVPPPEPERERPREPTTDSRPEAEPDGAGEEAVEPPEETPMIKLPPPGVAYQLPPAEGGLTENPDREGAEVDEGGLSFDTKWYDWGPYANKMLAKIRRNWRIPEIARLGVAGVVRIRFYIERDGTVTGLNIVNESGKPPMDFAARDAIGNSSPFDPLPAALGATDREGVTITFYYNARPPD
jgi:TonB family protein